MFSGCSTTPSRGTGDRRQSAPKPAHHMLCVRESATSTLCCSVFAFATADPLETGPPTAQFVRDNVRDLKKTTSGPLRWSI